jgi:hypothetical protein
VVNLYKTPGLREQLFRKPELGWQAKVVGDLAQL